MMQQLTMPRTQPLVLGGLSRGARWAAIAIASVAVPASIVLGALVAAPTTSNAVSTMAPVAPAAIDAAPVAPVSEPASVPPIPAAPVSDDRAAPASPQYSFVWTEECDSGCPGRGEF